ncbi:MAG: hypothetical protein ACRERU_02700 [Methylococcales bacterium]
MTIGVAYFTNRQTADPFSERSARRFGIVAAGLLGVLALIEPGPLFAAEASKFPDLVANVKQSIVGVGTFDPADVPPYYLLGTGFAVRDGLSIATCAHLIPNQGKLPKKGPGNLFGRRIPDRNPPGRAASFR